MVKKLSAYTLLASISICLLSCVSTMGCIGCGTDPAQIASPWNKKPQESFGLITVDIEFKPSHCSIIKKPKKRCDIEKLKLPSKTAKSIGSSIVVAKNKFESKTYVLTAAHVCTTEASSAFVFNNEYKVTVGQSVAKIVVTDYEGVERTATIYRIDAPNDLCIITTEGLWGTPFKVSPIDPVVGQKVYNVAAPHRIWAPGMVLMLDGYYSGKNDTGFYHYTIPARPGSSGSPILTHDGLIIGVVQRAVTRFENLGLSTSTQAIREILSTIPKEKPDPFRVDPRVDFYRPY